MLVHSRFLSSLLRPALALVAIALLAGQLDAQCAMCKEVVATSDNPEQVQRLSEGFYYSILFMIGLPMTMAGGLVGFIAWTNKQQRQLD